MIEKCLNTKVIALILQYLQIYLDKDSAPMADTGETPEMETETMSDIELSSDSEVEEEEGDEVSLIVMKRPAKIERTVKDIEVSSQLFYVLIIAITNRSYCRLWILDRGQETPPPSQPRSEPAR